MNKTAFNDLIRNIETNRGFDGKRINIDSIIISDLDYTYEHSFSNKGKELHEIRSISKLITSICIGIAIDSKKISINKNNLSLDTLIWETLSDKVSIYNISNIKNIEKITIRSLLTQTTGYTNDQLFFSHTIKDKDPNFLLDLAFNEPIDNEPGKHFVYSNVSAYILSAFFQELTGESLYSFAQRKLFKPLNIVNHFWANYGKYCAGATGLYLKNEDLHKIGKLILQEGAWGNSQIISRNYIKEMTKNHIKINDKKWQEHPLSPNAYGLFVWINKYNYYINGSKGQYLFINPTKKTVISILSNQENTNQLLTCIKELI